MADSLTYPHKSRLGLGRLINAWLGPALFTLLVIGFAGSPEAAAPAWAIALQDWFPWLSDPMMHTLVFAVRKGFHFAGYGLMMILSLRGTAVTWSCPRYAPAFLITLLVAIADEVNQTRLPLRTGAATDVAIDGAGALAAGLSWAAMRRSRAS